MSKIIIISLAVSGYRRGGIALVQGENSFELKQFSDEQLAQLEHDPQLKVCLSPTDKTSASTPPQGQLDSGRVSELVAHITTLDRDDASLWKADKTPKAAAFPAGTTAEERAAAWEIFVQDLAQVNTPPVAPMPDESKPAESIVDKPASDQQKSDADSTADSGA